MAAGPSIKKCAGGELGWFAATKAQRHNRRQGDRKQKTGDRRQIKHGCQRELTTDWDGFRRDQFNRYLVLTGRPGGGIVTGGGRACDLVGGKTENRDGEGASRARGGEPTLGYLSAVELPLGLLGH